MTNTADAGSIGAVVLAAGNSRRMGAPKMVLPWAGRTVIEQVVSVLLEAGVGETVVVTGGYRQQVEAALANWPVKLVYNPEHAQREMLVSLQVGVRALGENVQAFLVALGDQPGLDPGVVRAVMREYQASNSRLVIPSYQMRRGHPWLVGRELWQEILAMPAEATLRDFLNAHAGEIAYVAVDTAGILKDIDTPEDYQSQKP